MRTITIVKNNKNYYVNMLRKTVCDAPTPFLITTRYQDACNPKY